MCASVIGHEFEARAACPRDLGAISQKRIFTLLTFFAALGASGFAPYKEIRIEDVLKKAAAYCLKLESSALNFTCLEKVTESQTFIRRSPVVKFHSTLNQELNTSQNGMENAYELGLAFMDREGRSFLTRKNEWVYDYQLIRKQRVIDERRTLIKENGKNKKIENAPLATFRVWFKDAIMCPIGLLSEAAQKNHSYRILGEEKIYGIQSAIIDVLPLADGFPGLSGKAWVSLIDGAVLKVEWSPDSISRGPLVSSLALDLKATPRITFFSDFGIEKNGLRLLSSHGVTEAYFIHQERRLYTRSKLDVSYKDYKFFTVETEVGL